MSEYSVSGKGSVEWQPNRLIDEKSPYLLQHAYNPVDWHPWGEEAFKKAKAEDRPIFLSIGYSTCHWCHVMARESFEDPEVAGLMNETFVSVKVDREERPDLDHAYMAVCQMMTGGGGWPLTVVMTPDKKPFFAGTYFPRESRFGQTGMTELVPRMREIWSERRGELEASADAVVQAVEQITGHPNGSRLDESSLEGAYRQLVDRFDEEHGGFGAAPKFPTPHNILFLLRYWKRSGDSKALDMSLTTLRAIRMGGVYDQIGFGIHRYSTDAEWLLPHFEKMLYDQAMGAMAYTEAYQATGDAALGETAREILDYVLRDMTSSEGGFYSAEDADSEGEEGKFYVWTEAEIRDVVGEEDADLITKVFNVSPGGNYRDQATGRRTGSSILHMKKSMKELADELGLEESLLTERLESVRRKLFSAREKRSHPGRDVKILTDWNGLMVASLAKAGRVLSEAKYTEAARGAAEFLLDRMRDDKGRLYHRYRDGESGITGVLDDYAFFAWGLLELYVATFEVRYLEAAAELTGQMIEHFWDGKEGGFFFTSDDSENLIVRRKEIYDGATPSGNSVAALDLLMLARMTADARLEEKAAALLCAFSGTVTQSLSAHTQLLASLDFALGPSYEVVIVGRKGASDTNVMLDALRHEFIPNKVVLFKPAGHDSASIVRLARFTEYETSIDGKATAYVCRNYACDAPTTNAVEMLRAMGVDDAR